MTLTSFTSGINTTFSTELNQNSAEVLSLIGKEHIRTLIDRAGVYSADFTDGWGEAYVDYNGRSNSVNQTTDTTARFYGSSKYVPGINDISSSGTTHDPDSATDPSNAFDNDPTTYAEKIYENDSNISFEFGKTFTSTNIGRLYLKMYVLCNGDDLPIKIQTYDGSTWSDHTTLNAGSVEEYYVNTFRQIINIDDTIQGIRVEIIGSGGTGMDTTIRIYQMEYESTVATTSTEINHTIPSGTFSSTISNSFGTHIAEDWETGADIQYKLTNTGGDDTGWLNTNEISEFTAFTAEPDTLIVKLIPKSSSPTAGYPSINGFWVRAS